MFTNNIACFNKNYHVCLLITTRTNHNGEDNHKPRIYGHKQPSPSGSGGLWTINFCLLWFIYYIQARVLHDSLTSNWVLRITLLKYMKPNMDIKGLRQQLCMLQGFFKALCQLRSGILVVAIRSKMHESPCAQTFKYVPVYKILILKLPLLRFFVVSGVSPLVVTPVLFI